MSRLSEYFTDTPTNASIAFAAAAFGALVGNLTEGLPRWAIASLVAVGVLAFSLALGRQIYLRKWRSPRPLPAGSDMIAFAALSVGTTHRNTTVRQTGGKLLTLRYPPRQQDTP